ncbi:MAG: dihydrofolate reductase, partial [Lachnospiraceae bacterium]|nr:dihydrofolate reductase [Lachnospiraceae bacterium]
MYVFFKKGDIMITMIVTADKNWGIGKGGKKILDVPDDLKYIRDVSRGKTLLMGRKTFETMFQGKVLPDRNTIVLSRSEGYCPKGVFVADSIEQAMKNALESGQDIYIVGGESVFSQLLDLCDEVQVTAADYIYDADAFLENLDKHPEWV